MSKTIEQIKAQYIDDLNHSIKDEFLTKEDANAIYKALFKAPETNRILFSKDEYAELGPFSVAMEFEDLGMPTTGYPFDFIQTDVSVGKWDIYYINAPSKYQPILLQSIIIMPKD